MKLNGAKITNKTNEPELHALSAVAGFFVHDSKLWFKSTQYDRNSVLCFDLKTCSSTWIPTDRKVLLPNVSINYEVK